MICLNIQSKKVELQKDKVVVTETREINLTDGTEIEDLKRKLRMELGSIVRSVKSLKARADEIKGILEEIERQEKEAGPIKDPA
jgi:flagellar basal body P-ring protein FlgI